jgi:hypothetical protein
MLERTGHFIAVTAKPDVPKFGSDNILKATDAEQLAAFKGTLVDYGTYKVDEKSHTLILHVEGTNFLNCSGTDIHRVTWLSGNRMTWANPSGERKVPVLIWERLP